MLLLRMFTAVAVVYLVSGALCKEAGAKTGKDRFEQGIAHLNSGRYDRAIEAFSIILEVYPEDYETLNNRGIARSRKGQFDLAIDDFSKALEFYAAYAPAYINRGVVWQKKNVPGQAILDYTRGLEMAPEYTNAYAALAWILSTCPDPRYRDGKIALLLAQKATTLDTKALPLQVLAAVYAEMGEFYQAAAIQRKHIQLLESAGKVAQVERQAPVLAAYEDRRALYATYQLARTDSDQEVAAVMQRLRRLVGEGSPIPETASPGGTPGGDETLDPEKLNRSEPAPTEKNQGVVIEEAVVDLRPLKKKKGIDPDYEGSQVVGNKKDN